MTSRYQPLAAAFENLGANPLRTVLSMLGVIIGVASLVAILALGDGMERFGRDQLSAHTDLQVITFTPETTRRVDGLLVHRDTFAEFARADVAGLQAELGEDAVATLVLEGGWPARVPGDTTLRGVLATATLPATAAFTSDPLLAGRYLTEADVETDARVVVAGSNMAEWYGVEPAGLVGREVELRGVAYAMVGVREASGVTVRAEIPLSDGTRSSMEAANRRASLVLRAATVELVESVEARTRRYAERLWGDGAAFRVSVQKERVALARRGMLIFKLVMGSIAGISLLVGGIGIMNILLASVFERTREIGIRKATGARQRDILRQFLAESVLITGIGSLAGIVLGLAGAFAITAGIRASTDGEIYAAFSWTSVAVAAGAALIVGLLSGTYPARRAARLSPIEAIRHE